MGAGGCPLHENIDFTKWIPMTYYILACDY